jgi:hypothetical protein
VKHTFHAAGYSRLPFEELIVEIQSTSQFTSSLRYSPTDPQRTVAAPQSTEGDKTTISSAARDLYYASTQAGDWRSSSDHWAIPQYMPMNHANWIHMHHASNSQRDVLYLLALAMQAETASAADSTITAADWKGKFPPENDDALKELADLLTYRASLPPGFRDMSTASTAPLRSGLTNAQLDLLYQVAVDQRIQTRRLAFSIGMYETRPNASQARPSDTAMPELHSGGEESAVSADSRASTAVRTTGSIQSRGAGTGFTSPAGGSGTVPNLLQPLKDYLAGLSSHISAQFMEYLPQNNVAMPPSSFSYDPEGNIQLPPDYKYAGEFLQALENKPSLAKDMRIAAAITSHLNEMMKTYPFKEGDAISKTLYEYSNYINDKSRQKPVLPGVQPLITPEERLLSKVASDLGNVVSEHRALFLSDMYKYLYVNDSHKVTIALNL